MDRVSAESKEMETMFNSLVSNRSYVDALKETSKKGWITYSFEKDNEYRIYVYHLAKCLGVFCLPKNEMMIFMRTAMWRASFWAKLNIPSFNDALSSIEETTDKTEVRFVHLETKEMEESFNEWIEEYGVGLKNFDDDVLFRGLYFDSNLFAKQIKELSKKGWVSYTTVDGDIYNINTFIFGINVCHLSLGYRNEYLMDTKLWSSIMSLNRK